MSEIIDWLGLKDAQQNAAIARDQDIVVTAGAGSGKTRTLAARYLSLLDDGLQPQQISAVTFTEKAAREMRNRIRSHISRWRAEGCAENERARWEKLEADVDAARIGTIHSLCVGLLRAHPAEASIDPRLEVLDEGLAASEQAKSIEDTLGWAVEQPDFKPLFDSFTIGELRHALTKLLSSRLEVQPWLEQKDIQTCWTNAVLAAIDSFLHDAEIADAIWRLKGLNEAGELDADAGEKLATQCRGLLGEWESLLEARKARNYISGSQILLRIRTNHSAKNIGLKNSLAKDAIRVWRYRYECLVKPWLGDKADTAPNIDTEQSAATFVNLIGILFSKAAETYQSAKDTRQAADFDDLEAGAMRLLQNPTVRARWQGQTAALLVDEFQDTNERQRHIVEAIAGVTEGEKGKLFVVGDAKQSIYRFRGADVAVFHQLNQDIRKRGGQAISLDLSFRAHEQLLQILNELLGQAMHSTDDIAKPYQVPFAPLIANRKEPRAGIKSPFITFLYGLGDQPRATAAQMLADHLWTLKRNEDVQWDDIALLFRASGGFPAYEEALQKADIPFITIAGKGFYDRPEIRDILNILRALLDPWDDLAMAGLLRSPAFGLSDAALYQLRWVKVDQTTGEPSSFRDALDTGCSELSDQDHTLVIHAREIIKHLEGLVDRVTVAELIKAVLDATNYVAVLAATKEGFRLQRNVDKLLADAHSSGMVRVAEFLEYVETLRESGAREGEAPTEAGGAVRLMSVHKAKGLEFPIVVLADASRGRPNILGSVLLSNEYGLIPSPGKAERKPLIYGLAKSHEVEQSEAEDLRILYVAATRAQEKLIVCGHKSGRAAGSWFSTLASAAGIDLEAMSTTLDETKLANLRQSGMEVAVLTQVASNVENQVSEKQNESESLVHAESSAHDEPLYKPINAAKLEERVTEVMESPAHIKPMIGRRHHTDGTVIGNLVHEAIHRWRFPGDEGFEQLLTTVALTSGIVDSEDIAEHIHRASELLSRLCGDIRWTDIAAAQRYHEIPFGVWRDGRPSPGVIDLLYPMNAGMTKAWGIIDFKTDHIADHEELQKLTALYRPQLLRYRHAVIRLLGGQVETTLCFLDCMNMVRWVSIEPFPDDE